MKLLAATNNAHKLVEMRNILEPLGIEVLGAHDVGGIPDVEEDGDTFEANAIIKAELSASYTGIPVIADDSGLEVFALNREPGIHSSRYAGDDASDLDKINKVLGKLADKDDRSARFACVIAVATPHGCLGTVEGEVRGVIADAPIGDGGFGYDPVFVPEGYSQSFAEIQGDEKNRISHRGNALQNLVKSGLLERIDLASDLVICDDLTSISDGWGWLREKAGNWRIADGLEIDALPGTLWCEHNNAKNVLRRKAPAPRGAVEVTVTNQPKNGGEQAGIVLMADEDNYVKIVKESLKGATNIVLAHEVAAQGKPLAIIEYPDSDTAQLRLDYNLADHRVAGYYRQTVEDPWTLAGECAPPEGPDIQLCLAAHGGDESPARKALFQRFRLLS